VAVRQLLDKHQAHEVKTIGDALMLRTGDAAAAIRQGAPSPAGLPIDPVCRMAVDPWHGAGRLTHEGVEYCFCSLGCAGAFAQHPTRYTANDR
jgi:YHS domain-containing protein